MKATSWIIGIVAVVIVVVGGLWFSATRQPVEAPTVDDETGEMMMKEDGVGEGMDEMMEHDDAMVSGGAQPTAAVVETATLAAVGTYTGSGTATRSFDGATFRHAVTAQLGDPAVGKFYEGWLVMPAAGGPQFFSTGRLDQQGSGYALSYTASQNYPDHTMAVITEETIANGLDGVPEAHVLEGSF